MTHTHKLIEAKIFMKARKLKQREKRNYNIAGLILTAFLVFPSICFSVKPSYFTMFVCIS